MKARELFEQLGEIVYDGGGDLEVVVEMLIDAGLAREEVASVRVGEMNGVKQLIVSADS